MQSYWFVKSDHLGKVSVGLQSTAGDNAAILVDGSGSLVPANWVLFDNGAFFIRSGVDPTFGFGSTRPDMGGPGLLQSFRRTNRRRLPVKSHKCRPL